MTEADVLIQAMHAGFDELSSVAQDLTSEQLAGFSAATEWTIAEVLSHLGSGAVIALATLDAALAGQPNPGNDASRPIWAHWNAMQPQEQASEFVAANRALLERYDSLDTRTRERLFVDMGFMPQPVPLALQVRFRLHEFTLHSWDVRVALDPSAALSADAVPLLLGQTEMMLGWVAKPANLPGRQIAVELFDPARAFGVFTGDSATVGDVPADPDSTLTLPAEAWLRLAAGRLAPKYTPDDAKITGSVTFDEVRSVFPGY